MGREGRSELLGPLWDTLHPASRPAAWQDAPFQVGLLQKHLKNTTNETFLFGNIIRVPSSQGWHSLVTRYKFVTITEVKKWGINSTPGPLSCPFLNTACLPPQRDHHLDLQHHRLLLSLYIHGIVQSPYFRVGLLSLSSTFAAFICHRVQLRLCSFGCRVAFPSETFQHCACIYSPRTLWCFHVGYWNIAIVSSSQMAFGAQVQPFCGKLQWNCWIIGNSCLV